MSEQVKPAFNPNQPFEADKPKFDASASFEPVQETSPESSSIMDGLKGLASNFAARQRGMVKGASLGYLDPANLPGPLGKMYSQAGQENPKTELGYQAVGGVLPGGIAGMGAAAIAPVGAGVLPTLGRVATSAATNGASGYAQKPAEGQTRAGNAKLGAILGGGTQLAGEAISPAAKKISDYLMQKAVGMRKYLRGVGNSLVNQGVMGTKGMMEDQVASKLSNEENNLQDLVSQLDGKVNSKEIGDAVAQHGTKFINPDTGNAFPGQENYLNQIRQSSEGLSQMPDLSPKAALALKRSGDYISRTASGNVGSSIESETNATAANKAREALYKMSPDVADSLFKEKALINASKSLAKPETIHQSLGGAAIFGKIPGTSLIGSTAAHGIQNTAGQLDNPEITQSLLGALLRNNSSQR